ncbi:MAG: LysM peptidoglycan-binding domain-containing protein [Anaerolineae bacterium]
MTKFIQKRLKPLAVIAIIGLMLAINAFSVPEVQAQDPASEIFRLVNNFRVSLGLPAFRWNNQLAAASQTQANWMVANPNSFVHTWPDGTTKENRASAAGYNGRVVENIVGGWDMTPPRALEWWQNSPVHYNTITSNFYVEAGTAYAGSGRQGRYVIVVGNRGAAAATRPIEPEAEPIYVEPVIIAEPDADGQVIHTVGRGHALWTLAAYYEVKVSDLLLYNNMSENDLVSVGDEIIIQPANGWVPPPTPTPPYSVFVQTGQTLWSIAAIHNIPLSDILLFNGLDADAFINKGDEIKIRLQPGEQPPTPTPTATPVQRYVVRTGDSAWSISARFGISLDQLLVWNGLPADPLLSVGQELWVVSPSLSQQAGEGSGIDPSAILAADIDPNIEMTSTPELPTATTGSQSPSAQVTTPSETRTPTPTTSTNTQPEAIEIADISEDQASNTANEIDGASLNSEVTRLEDRPETILNLPLILALLAVVFLGFGGWLFLQSRKI